MVPFGSERKLLMLLECVCDCDGMYVRIRSEDE
jgi:hypothetical protein